jgi:hypothetical protein
MPHLEPALGITFVEYLKDNTDEQGQKNDYHKDPENVMSIGMGLFHNGYLEKGALSL